MFSLGEDIAADRLICPGLGGREELRSELLLRNLSVGSTDVLEDGKGQTLKAGADGHRPSSGPAWAT